MFTFSLTTTACKIRLSFVLKFMILNLSSFSHDLSIVTYKKPPACALQLKNYYMRRYSKGAIQKTLQ